MNRGIFFHKTIATGFGSGYFPKAPGTAGAALAAFLWWILSVTPLSSCALASVTAVLIVVFTGLGVWSSGVMAAVWNDEDPSRVTIDEMVGVWIPLLAVKDGNIYYMICAFVLFRLFDIFKPFGIRKMEKIKGGWGIMMDDIVAGIYSLLILAGIQWAIG
ncbi:MAG: phosphatidylglycerophosphatase A [Dysgonamonadaceae bacterium]|jgi:phosphatidylglycerophosphatase A|nr:phosphatidylglycerophosphatase A [Dysgonamonadaceae bacterium]